MSASLGLYRLQVVDSRIDEIKTRLDRIREILENDEELRKTGERLNQAKQEHLNMEKALKRAEEDVANQKIKIEQSESRLYSGTVKNPKELEDLQNEVAALKRYLATLEDNQLEAMLDEEAAIIKEEGILAEYEQVQQRLKDQNHDLRAEQETLEKDLKRFESERQAAIGPLDKMLLTIYDELRQQKRGLAVVVVNDGACTACGTTLTPAQYQKLRSPSQLFNCPSCKRIMFAN